MDVYVLTLRLLHIGGGVLWADCSACRSRAISNAAGNITKIL